MRKKTGQSVASALGWPLADRGGSRRTATLREGADGQTISVSVGRPLMVRQRFLFAGFIPWPDLEEEENAIG